MNTQEIQEWEKEFDEKFGNNVVWWKECLAEMQIGDPDFNRLKSFISQKLKEQKAALESKYENCPQCTGIAKMQRQEIENLIGHNVYLDDLSREVVDWEDIKRIFKKYEE